MANKPSPSPSRQHKHLAVLIDADNASVATVEDISEADEGIDTLRAIHPMHVQTTLAWPRINQSYKSA